MIASGVTGEACVRHVCAAESALTVMFDQSFAPGYQKKRYDFVLGCQNALKVVGGGLDLLRCNEISKISPRVSTDTLGLAIRQAIGLRSGTEILCPTHKTTLFDVQTSIQ